LNRSFHISRSDPVYTSPISFTVEITDDYGNLVYGPEEIADKLLPQVDQAFYWDGTDNDGDLVNLFEEYTVTFTLLYDNEKDPIVKEAKIIPGIPEQTFDDNTIGDPVNAQRGSYDLTESDLSMPVENGINLVRSYFNNREEGRIQSDYELLFPFGISDWTHNYVKYLKIPPRNVTGRVFVEVKDGNINGVRP